MINDWCKIYTYTSPQNFFSRLNKNPHQGCQIGSLGAKSTSSWPFAESLGPEKICLGCQENLALFGSLRKLWHHMNFLWHLKHSTAKFCIVLSGNFFKAPLIFNLFSASHYANDAKLWCNGTFKISFPKVCRVVSRKFEHFYHVLAKILS